MSKNRTVLNGLKLLFGAICLFMTYLVITTSIKSDLFHLPQTLTREPWFTATLWDFYFNIAIISAWVVYKEKRKAAAVLWVIGFILLGSIATSLYVLIQLLKLRPSEGIEKVLLKN